MFSKKMPILRCQCIHFHWTSYNKSECVRLSSYFWFFCFIQIIVYFSSMTYSWFYEYIAFKHYTKPPFAVHNLSFTLAKKYVFACNNNEHACPPFALLIICFLVMSNAVTIYDEICISIMHSHTHSYYALIPK